MGECGALGGALAAFINRLPPIEQVLSAEHLHGCHAQQDHEWARRLEGWQDHRAADGCSFGGRQVVYPATLYNDGIHTIRLVTYAQA